MVPQLSQARICSYLNAVKAEPDARSESTSEVIFGEPVLVLEQDNQWASIKTIRDGYKGFVPAPVCEFSKVAATHWVSNRATLLFEQADIKSTVTRRLLFGSELTVTEQVGDGKFLQLDSGDFIWSAHCQTADNPLQQSMTEIAHTHYLNAPYLWGGKSTDGCDCSGLVQMLARATGRNLPRDSGDQESYLNCDIPFASRANGDLVYWPGHVGVLQSSDTLLHATAHSMRCCVESLDDVIKRAGAPSSIKRMDGK